MYFRKLELFGFKSFPDRVKIIFEQGITAVVGPNGSGKTNIADAIRWILGEQSPRLLRGSRMEDIIFSGTQNRKPLGFAEAFLTLDNSKGVFPIDYNELKVGRRLYRSGESEYYINKKACRLKDIEELFMDTGLGKRAYSLIDQEKISLILSSSPEERRALFEEAAGIMKYKVRKEEALRKLEKTEENLLRLGDVITEVDRQLNSISRHFQKAQRYKKYKEELDNLEIKLGRHQWFELKSLLSDKKRKNVQAKRQKDEFLQKIKEEESKIEGGRQNSSAIESRLSKKQTKAAVENKELETADENIKLSERYLKEIKEEESSKAVQLEFLSQREKEKEKELEQVYKELKDLKSREDEEERNLSEIGKTAGLISQETENCKKASEKIKLEIFELERSSAQNKNQLGMLEDRVTNEREASLLNLYSRRTERVSALKLKEKALEELKGSLTFKDYFHKTEGKAGRMFEVEPKYLPAIEAGLACFARALVVKTFSIAKECLSVIKEKLLERQDFIVLDRLSQNLPLLLPDAIFKNENVIGKASDLIKCRENYRPLFDYFLGKVLVVKNFTSAEKIINELNFPWRIVTLAGELIELPGVVSGGSLKELSKFISQENEIKGLENELIRLKKDLGELDEEEKQRKAKITEELEGEKNKLFSQLETNEKLGKTLESDLENKEIEYGKKNKELENAREAIVNLKIELKAVKERQKACSVMVHHLKGTSEERNSSIFSWSKEIEKRREREDGLKKNIENLKRKIETIKLESEEINKEIVKLQFEKEESIDIVKTSEENLRALEKDKDLKQETAHNLDLEAAAVEMELNNLSEKLKENYELCLGEEENRDREEDIENIKKRAEFLKRRVESMGAVNLVALEEHKELEERSHFLKGQEEDLKKSKESLIKVIQEISRTTRSLFTETFTQIQTYFSEIFRFLFGGGTAKLVLLDADNILESGIEIAASPPGKKMQNINLFSGGEKSLTAIALLIALFKIKPSPFCVLDESDAALDETNVNRFTSLLKQFSDKTQFIVITHNKETIAVSDVIYGVTMEEAGISKIVSVKLTQSGPG